jgi:hypothetical protein
LSNVSKNVAFDKKSEKLRKSKVYQLTDFKNNKTKLKLEKFEDGKMILYDYLQVGINDLKEPLRTTKEDILKEDKKITLKLKETLR